MSVMTVEMNQNQHFCIFITDIIIILFIRNGSEKFLAEWKAFMSHDCFDLQELLYKVLCVILF